jgi:iron complex outermembrane receptor protein
MENYSKTHTKVVCFSHWSRKSYAVFNSLGRTIRIGVLSLACSILVLPGNAQENRDSVKTPETILPQELDEVVVSAQLSPAIQSQLMRVVQVITRVDIEQSPTQDLAGLLESTRGIDIRKRGAFGMQADVSIRGGTFDQTLILLNGINITDPQTGHHNLNVPVDLQSIERIEVLQGAGARVFGPNAFNGAINIITRTPGSKTIRASFSAGEYSFGHAGIAAGFETGTFKHFLSAGGLTSDGFAKNTDFKSGNIFYHNQTSLADSEFHLQAGYNQKGFGANSFYTPRFPDQYEETRIGFASLKWASGGDLNLTSSVYWRRHHDRFELFRYDAPDWYTSHNYHQTNVAGATLNWSEATKLGITSLGFDYRFEHIYSNVLGHEMNQTIPVWGYDNAFFTHSYQRAGLSFMAEHTVYVGKFSTSGGLLTYVSNELDDGVSFFPGLDLGWQFTDNLRWFSSINRTLRLPTFTDLFYSGPGNIGNPLLKPEEAISFETGLKNRWKNIEMDFVFFRRWGTNMIDWIKEPGDEQWQSLNLTQVNITGIETGVVVPLAKPAGFAKPALSVQYTYVDSGKSSSGFVSNYALDHLRHKLDIGLTHTFIPGVGASFRVSWQERAGGFMLYQDGVFQDLQDFEPYWLVDMKLFWQIGRVQLFAEASNLFNSQVVSIANVPQPGRWARASLKGEF